MLQVVGCFIGAHDYRLVALAALICGLASFTSIQLLCHAARSTKRLRPVWIAVAATAGGVGIWATHFIAMLAFAPSVPTGYTLSLTILSLVYAISLTGLGFGVAVWPRLRAAGWIGGAMVGSGIVAMHYTGMAAFEVAGHIGWSLWLVSLSVVLAVVLGSLACALALGARSLSRQILAAVLLLLAICSHHFTAMGAITIAPDPTLDVAPSSMPAAWLAAGVAVASFAILFLAGAAVLLDLRDRRQALLEGVRLQSLANAAVEGLLVCQGSTIISANQSFSQLVGVSVADLCGRSLSAYLPQDALRSALIGEPDRSVEFDLQRADGTTIPVELIARTLDYAKQPHHAIAVRDLRARRKAEQQIQFMAMHDGLTGLANRTSFNQRLERELHVAKATNGKLAVLCLDLDRFKEVNDLFGHGAGDKLLQDVARITTSVLDESQLMSRLGGDEFVVLSAVENAVAAGRLAESILDALRTQSRDGSGAAISTSIGIALYPDDASDRTLLLNYADTALYRAKSEGRGTYRFFETRMGAEVRERRLIEHDLRYAMARGEISIAYQPQADTETGQVTGFEALLRWHNPQRGFVSPSVFIPVAEESGLIVALGEWVLQETCREAASWPVPLSIAVNVSAMQIHMPNFANSIHEALFRSGLPPHRLEIEITETALVRDPIRALAALRQVKALGVRVAMDDFGTGYSSLSNLRMFPFDRIKIDGSFIKAVDRDEQTAAIVRSVLGLGRGLGLPVIAEGVETPSELEFLRAEDCNQVQGFLLAKPAAIDNFVEHTHGEAFRRAMQVA